MITTSPPSLALFVQPQNETFNSTQVQLNFIIIKPDSWFSRGNPLGDYVFVNITSVYYIVDNGERQSITVHDAVSLISKNPPNQTLTFLTSLNLSAGQHSVKIGIEAVSFYVPYILSSNPFSNITIRALSIQSSSP